MRNIRVFWTFLHRSYDVVVVLSLLCISIAPCASALTAESSFWGFRKKFPSNHSLGHLTWQGVLSPLLCFISALFNRKIGLLGMGLCVCGCSYGQWVYTLPSNSDHLSHTLGGP